MNLLTRKFPTVLGLFLLVGVIVSLIYYVQVIATQVPKDIIPEKVKITNISDSKFTISWITEGLASGAVEYGLVGEKLTSVAKDERDSQDFGQYISHHVLVEQLQPSTEYAFRILSGNKKTKFDNNGSPYTVSTGPVIGETPISKSFYGNVILPSKQPANGAIVYLKLPGSEEVSALVREGGNYAFTLSTMRTDNLRSYVDYDPSASIASLTIEGNKQQTFSSVSLSNSAPVPTITLGENADFLNVSQTPDVAELKPQQTIPEASPGIPPILNVDPISDGDINVVSNASVTLINPKTSGETLSTLRPEFRGMGPAQTILSIALTGQKAISDTVSIANDGTWSWAPVIDLKTGKQMIRISYLDSVGTTQKIEREFNISTSQISSTPAFVSSSSASTNASSRPVSSSSPRSEIPATDSGIPVTGVIENTLLTGGLGIVIMVIGVTLLSL